MLATHKLLLPAVLLFAALPTLAAEETPGVAPSVAPNAIVKCPGVTSIPLTADAEQALPLRLVGSLSCGEAVYVLSEDEGYTAHIRTSDGKDGYVARMYLLEGEVSPRAAAPLRRPSSAKPVNGIVRWSAGAPGCAQFVSHGRHVESITANGITVQVSLQDTGWKFRANVAISNQSASKIDVTPGLITLDELKPNLRMLPASDSDRIARTSTHQVLWTFANAVPSPSAVAPQSVREPQTDGSLPTPDYLNPHMALASDHPSGFARTESIDVEAIALKYVSISEGQNTAGVMWFARDPGSRELSMRLPVGDLICDFSFAFDQKK